ncbi:hypothetical protein BKA70DRAFT_1432307 [Coprinopsis sp. MPI-PUGE-AT-0042]|nr:hypothetical protein BKA70DRAFT_1432307 [Coprinopsis sp. MPI-PUGE-AT-0042]
MVHSPSGPAVRTSKHARALTTSDASSSKRPRGVEEASSAVDDVSVPLDAGATEDSSTNVKKKNKKKKKASLDKGSPNTLEDIVRQVSLRLIGNMNLSKAPLPTKLSASAALVKSMAGAATSAAALSKPSKPAMPAEEEEEEEEEDELNLSTQVPVSKGKDKALPDTASESDDEEESDEDADEDVDKNRGDASAAGSIQDKATIPTSKPPPPPPIKPVSTTPPIRAFGAATTDQGILRGKATNQNMADMQEDTEEPLVMDWLVRIVEYSGTNPASVEVPPTYATIDFVNKTSLSGVMSQLLKRNLSLQDPGISFYIWISQFKAWKHSGDLTTVMAKTSSDDKMWTWEENEDGKIMVLYLLIHCPFRALSLPRSRSVTPAWRGNSPASLSGASVPRSSLTPAPSPLASSFGVDVDGLTEETAADVEEVVAALGPLDRKEAFSPDAYRIIKHCGMPLNPLLYSGTTSTSVRVTYERWSLTKDAKAVYNARKNIPRLPPPPPDAPLSSQPWLADFKIKEEDIVDILSNKTTWGDWVKAFTNISSTNPEYAEVYCYLSDPTYDPGKSEEEIFLAKPGTKGIGLVFSFQGLSNKGRKDPERESEREKQKERQRRLAEQAEVQQTEADGKKKKKKKKDSKKDRKATILWCICLAIFQVLAQLLSLLAGSRLGRIWLCLAVLPLALGHPTTSPYPDISFSTFSTFILSTFDPKISLASVMIILSSSTAWMEHFASQLAKRFPAKTPLLPCHSETTLSTSLVNLAKLLHLNPYDKYDLLVNERKPIDLSSVEPSLAIVSKSYECQNQHCKRYSLFPHMKKEEIAQVTLIKGAKPYSHAFRCILSQDWQQSLRQSSVFTQSVCNAIYSFHASAQAFTEYFNDSYSLTPSSFASLQSTSTLISCRHSWQAFMQESLRMVSGAAGRPLTVALKTSVDLLAKRAYTVLGQGGKLSNAQDHACIDCTQPWRSDAEGDPYAMEEEDAWVNMRVVDGIVTGPYHCAYPDCDQPLANYRGESYCDDHVAELGQLCRMAGCQEPKVNQTKACLQHQPEWNSHVATHNKSHLAGVNRIIRNPGEALPWQNRQDGVPNPHDQPDAGVPLRKNYFSPGKLYCVETLCAPCGVPIAWKLFDKSESPTNIITFLDDVYPAPTPRPNFIAIDKACIVLKTLINHRPDCVTSTHFIVDTYHHKNHSKDDSFCQEWCDPAPSDGSVPNLVIMKWDAEGRPIWLRAFNTQACEQLNAWLASYDSILKRMTLNNFNWFLHAILFLHAKKVLVRQERKIAKTGNDDSEESTDDSEESTDDSEESTNDEDHEDHEDESGGDSNDNDSEDDSDNMLVD